MPIKLKRKELQWLLQDLEPFETPNMLLEQYCTGAEIAASCIHAMCMSGDIDGKFVADLGAGVGNLAVAAAAAGAAVWDCSHATDSRDRWVRAFDTVIMNPPFGTKKNKGVDMAFLDRALRLAAPGGSVYSFHKSATRQHVLRRGRALGASECTVMAELIFDLPASYKQHKQRSVDVQVDLIQFRLPR